MKILILGPSQRNEKVRAFLENKGHIVDTTIEEIDIDAVKNNGVDFLVSNGYAPIIKPSVIRLFPRRIINIHPSYLPYGRGVYGNLWSFFSGTPKGVSIHYIDEGIDSGAVIARKLIDFEGQRTLADTFNHLMKSAEDLFMEYWQAIENQSCDAVDQGGLTEEGSYHNRRQSERVIDLLPALWETETSVVQNLGADLNMTADFWRALDLEIQRRS